MGQVLWLKVTHISGKPINIIFIRYCRKSVGKACLVWTRDTKKLVTLKVCSQITQWSVDCSTTRGISHSNTIQMTIFASVFCCCYLQSVDDRRGERVSHIQNENKKEDKYENPGNGTYNIEQKR